MPCVTEAVGPIEQIATWTISLCGLAVTIAFSVFIIVLLVRMVRGMIE